MMSFGQRLRLLRKEAQMTQSELAEQLMVSTQSVSKWECDSTMPDISQIVPLANILNVTTDCLLGVGRDQKADTERLKKEVEEIWNNYKSNAYEDNANFMVYETYKEHIKKYPLDYTAKYHCANAIYNFISRSNEGERYSIPAEEEQRLYEEALKLLGSIKNYDKDPTRLIHARYLSLQLLVLKKEFDKAEPIAEEFPSNHITKNDALLEIYLEKKDYDKSLEIADDMCLYEVGRYLRSLWIRARCISIFGNVRKWEAIAAWNDLLEAAKHSHKIFKNRSTLWWVLQTLGRISNDYIAISEFDKAFETIEEYTSFAIESYNEFKAKGTLKKEEMDTMLSEIRNDLRGCFWWCFSTEVNGGKNIITNDERYKKCEKRLAELE